MPLSSSNLISSIIILFKADSSYSNRANCLRFFLIERMTMLESGFDVDTVQHRHIFRILETVEILHQARDFTVFSVSPPQKIGKDTD